jgi:hypothetical protein
MAPVQGYVRRLLTGFVVTGAKKAFLVSLAGLALAGGCASGLRQLAPPGIYKYEDLEKGEPIDPAMKARIDAEDNAGDRSFPVLSDQPTGTPEGVAEPERAAMRTGLVGERDALTAAVAADRAAADAEASDAELAAMKARVAEETAQDSAAAAADKSAPPIRVD